MRLLELPSEIIQKIIAESIPDDIENLVLACKHLYEAGSIFLSEHNTLRKQFRHFRYDRTPASSTCSAHEEGRKPLAGEMAFMVPTPMDLLELIAERPVIAHYIRSADLGRDPALDWHDVHQRDQAQATNLGSPQPHGDLGSSSLGDLVRKSLCLREAGVDIQRWWEDMATTSVGHADVLLLTLLPNLRELRPNRGWGDLDVIFTHSTAAGQRPQKTSPVLWDVLDVIVRRANDPAQMDASLSKLAVLRPFRGVGYQNRPALSPCVPFLALDSLKEFRVGSCIFFDGYTGRPFAPRYERYGKQLEKVDMVGCISGPKELAELLSRLPALRIFRFCFEIKWHGCGYSWDVGKFLAAIQTHAGDKLDEFSLSMLNDYGERGTTLSSMKGFRKLKVLELDLDLLLGPAHDPNSTNPAWLDAQSPPGDPAMPRLVDLLPESLSRFNLHWRPWPASKLKKIAVLENLVRGFAQEREVRLPSLTDVTVVCGKVGEQDSQVVGAVLDVVRAEGASVVFDASGKCLPSFVTTFLQEIRGLHDGWNEA